MFSFILPIKEGKAFPRQSVPSPALQITYVFVSVQSWALHVYVSLWMWPSRPSSGSNKYPIPWISAK